MRVFLGGLFDGVIKGALGFVLLLYCAMVLTVFVITPVAALIWLAWRFWLVVLS